RLGEPGPVAFSCGSGVSACVGALAAVAAGWEDRDLTIYDGSWSEWGRESENPAARPVVGGS
ncbi:MAG: rhodanese-like domain-containing protein, partial [Kocuria palustris]